jgi:ABC-type bacteriocin/lantibiotic exporter with double-glycine peptidase domain
VIVLLGKIPGRHYNYREILPGVIALKSSAPRWLSILVDQINAGLRSPKLQIFYTGINSLLVGLENILIVWFGAKMVIAGEFSAGALIAFCLKTSSRQT